MVYTWAWSQHAGATGYAINTYSVTGDTKVGDNRFSQLKQDVYVLMSLKPILGIPVA